MLARLRLIVVLLLVALPLQGLASTPRALCDHAPGSASSTVWATHADPEVGKHPHADPNAGYPWAHEHAGDVAHAVHSAGHHAADGSGDSPDDASAEHPIGLNPGSCAHCAACCVGAALAGAVTTLKALPAPQSPFAFAAITAPSRPFDGPERPPRTA